MIFYKKIELVSPKEEEVLFSRVLLITNFRRKALGFLKESAKAKEP
jgi:hypothetical protein